MLVAPLPAFSALCAVGEPPLMRGSSDISAERRIAKYVLITLLVAHLPAFTAAVFPAVIASSYIPGLRRDCFLFGIKMEDHHFQRRQVVAVLLLEYCQRRRYHLVDHPLGRRFRPSA